MKPTAEDISTLKHKIAEAFRASRARGLKVTRNDDPNVRILVELGAPRRITRT